MDPAEKLRAFVHEATSRILQRATVHHVLYHYTLGRMPEPKFQDDPPRFICAVCGEKIADVVF